MEENNMSEYVKRVIEETKAKNPNEPEFLQTVEEVLTSIEPVVERHPEYEAAALLERLVEPERQVMFRVAWTDDEDDPQYEYSKANLEVLNNSTDAKGRKINVHKLYVPSVPQRIRQDELDGYEFEEGEAERDLGERLAASYVNFYIGNRTVLVPAFGDPNDVVAVKTLASLFPDRAIQAIPARNILLGGGNIHCITQQIPLA